MKSMNKIFKLLSIVIIPLVTNSCVISFAKKSNQLTIENYTIIDGDTIRFFDKKNSKFNSIRILGIDTPETLKKYNKVAKLENIYANKAKDFLYSICSKKPIHIEIHSKDKYNRLVAIVKNFRNKDVAKELISEGLARVKYISKTRNKLTYWNNKNEIMNYYDELIAIQSIAKKSKKGFWQFNENLVFAKK
ncbi:Thermonuclease precursor [Mycoplasmopsis bovigenitalium]|uniref:Thermonuclease n=2 Tax=Mycoplasmopsis bovigenitalium TaxID=2112 RepID=A0A449AA01_9BACT|nr:Thermonuclease precursor [Mycoplasmopsis bovigenitalium]